MILIFWKNRILLEFRFKITFLNGGFEVPLKKNDKKYFFQTFFQIHVIFCLDWIRKWPRYVKVSVWWALKGYNNGFLIFDDLGRKSGKMRLRIFDLKAKSWTFFSKVKNRCLNIRKWKIVIMRWKPMPWRYFQHIIIMSFENCVKKILFMSFFLLVWKMKEFIKWV